MENRYHYKLNLPVKFIPNPKFFNDYPEPCHVKFSINDVNKDLQTFLISLGVYIMDVELFVRDSSTKNFIHLDGDKFSDIVIITQLSYLYINGSRLRKASRRFLYAFLSL